MSESTREKNEKIIKKQETKQKDVEVKNNIEEMTQEELNNKLSKKNTEYLYKLKKELIDSGKTEEETDLLLNGLIKDIYLNQIKGIPANKLFGTPTQKANDLLHVKKAPIKQPFWKIAVDTSLLFLALFAAMYGIMGMFSKNSKGQNQTGIITLILISVMWGIILSWFNIQMKKEKSKRPNLLKTILYMAGGLIIMFAVLMLTTNLPVAINPVLNPTIYLIIAIVSFTIRYFFRKTNKITTSTFF
ncbi:DUF1129 domain-containing protein [Companilactobacillus sp. DQM5]|uniref:DUF1129 domain-containing protein n=1 Tax=Companilactobacillus sp. DQM5 TaxID=3463359 RepID=UPI0040592432